VKFVSYKKKAKRIVKSDFQNLETDSVIRFLEFCNGFYHPFHEKYKINEMDLAIHCTLL